jgi:antitoxin PrlF
MGVITSKLSMTSETVIPPEVCERLGVKPGDTLRYVITDRGVLLLPDRAEEDDPFVAFTEWASPEDEDAFKDLR